MIKYFIIRFNKSRNYRLRSRTDAFYIGLALIFPVLAGIDCQARESISKKYLNPRYSNDSTLISLLDRYESALIRYMTAYEAVSHKNPIEKTPKELGTAFESIQKLKEKILELSGVSLVDTFEDLQQLNAELFKKDSNLFILGKDSVLKDILVSHRKQFENHYIHLSASGMGGFGFSAFPYGYNLKGVVNLFKHMNFNAKYSKIYQYGKGFYSDDENRLIDYYDLETSSHSGYEIEGLLGLSFGHSSTTNYQSYLNELAGHKSVTNSWKMIRVGFIRSKGWVKPEFEDPNDDDIGLNLDMIKANTKNNVLVLGISTGTLESYEGVFQHVFNQKRWKERRVVSTGIYLDLLWNINSELTSIENIGGNELMNPEKSWGFRAGFEGLHMMPVGFEIGFTPSSRAAALTLSIGLGYGFPF